MNRTRRRKLREIARFRAPSPEYTEAIYKALKKTEHRGSAPPFKGHMTLSTPRDRR